MSAVPSPHSELHVVRLQTVGAFNYWSRRAVTRLDLAIGAYDEIPSNEIDGFNDRLARALPGLLEHECSVGERGGFLVRLARGTYVPHIVEHVALELQRSIGHDVGYGRTRGGDRDGEYTVIFAHQHAGVGLRAAWLALEVVAGAIDGTLGEMAPMLAELRAIARTPTPEATMPVVKCVITGGHAGARAMMRARIASEDGMHPGDVVDVAPGYILEAGLPVSRADVAVILDATLDDVPPRYREPDRAERLVSVVLDALGEHGVAMIDDDLPELQRIAREAGHRIATVHAGVAP